MRAGSRIAKLLWWASLACLIGGGVLWALSPLGVELSELKFKTPNVFWKLFPFSPALLFVGLIGLYLWRERGRGTVANMGLWAALVGSALIVAGDVGLFHLGVDDTFIMSAPAYRALRTGLVLLAAGALLFGVVETRGGRLPAWGGLAFALSALAGLVAVARDLGPLGAALWAVFGAGWVWLAFVLFVDSPQNKAQTGGGKQTGEVRAAR